MRTRIAIALVLLPICIFRPSQALGQPKATAANQTSGITLLSKGVHLSIQALRDDVLRVRYWRGATMPEDASWAVLPDARKSSVKVASLSNKTGFTTSALRVEIDPQSLQITIYDKQNNILQQDAAPIDFRGNSFELAQKMTAASHYFGLGDKTGAFDRREQVFTLWNTDAYNWQESTDPIYKSIPFFVTYEAGRAVGTLLDNTWRSHFDFGRTRSNTLVM